MKIYFNGWFSGFFEKTNPGIHITFFLNLLEKVYCEKCEIGTLENSEILCEFDMLISTVSFVNKKQWKHTYLFSGESTLKCNKSNYNCVLWGERNYDNVINLPLFIPYIYTNNFLQQLEEQNIKNTVPDKDILVIVSNPNGQIRNKFLNKLEKRIHVSYVGRYKNNAGGLLKPQYNTKKFKSIVAQFKFIISMENSREDTYITEKVVHGLLAGTIPVYWGSTRVTDYFNNERLLIVNDESKIDTIIENIIEIKNNNNKWLEIVNKPVFNNNKLERTIDIVARDIRCLLNNNCWKHISRVYCINNPIFEPEHYNNLVNLFKKQNISLDYISYISPTYKHTITDEIYNKNISKQQVLNLRRIPMKKSELSLILNNKAIFKDIEKNYKDGLFFIFESDILQGKQINDLNNFLNEIYSKRNYFDLIHIGQFDNRIWQSPNFNGTLGYNNIIKHNINNEDISDKNSSFRLSRKFYTRCTDSFLWNYIGIIKIINYMDNIDKNFGCPFDLYFSNFLQKNIDFKHYWSENEFFIQGSNNRLIRSTIQSDIN